MSEVPENITRILFGALLLAQSDGAQAEIKLNGAVLHVSYRMESLESDSVEVVPSWWQPGQTIQNFLTFFIPDPAFQPEKLMSEDLSAMPYSWGSRIYPTGERKLGLRHCVFLDGETTVDETLVLNTARNLWDARAVLNSWLG